jgi:hypothetical protein
MATTLCLQVVHARLFLLAGPSPVLWACLLLLLLVLLVLLVLTLLLHAWQH